MTDDYLPCNFEELQNLLQHISASVAPCRVLGQQSSGCRNRALIPFSAEGGHWKPERVVVIEFPDMDAFDVFYNSPEYQPLIALRKSCTSDQDMLFVLEGA